MSEDEWVSVAMTDDMLVVRMLLKLTQAELPPPPPKSNGSTLASLLDWRVRQRRSKQVPRKKAEPPNRASPTTPLSWSGATSASGCAADGFEETSVPAKTIDIARSEVAVTIGTPSIKRSRRKKTLTELKEEENLLLKERRNLKNQLATLGLTIVKERTRNESLKRMKLDLLSRQKPETVAASFKSEEVKPNQPQQLEVVFDITRSTSCNKQKASPPHSDGGEEPLFLLPDLNLPVEDDLGADVLYRTV